MNPEKSKSTATVFLILCLLLLLSSCEKEPSKPYILGEKDGLTEAFLEEFPQYEIKEINNTEKYVPLYAVHSGNIAECLDVQAMPAIKSGMEYSFCPQHLATIVLAVDRGQTSTHIQSWQDLLKEDLLVSFPDTGAFRRTALAAVAYGLSGTDYTKEEALSYLNTLQEQNRLRFDDSSCPITICFDIQAVRMAEEGRQIEIIVPKDGTLSFSVGFLSKKPIAGVSDNALLHAGLRLMDGKCHASQYPEKGAYAAAAVVSDYEHFNAVTQDAVRDIRRKVQHIRILASADGREHILSFIAICIFILIWSAFAFYRSYRKDVRRFITLISALCIGWMLVSMFKYQLGNTQLLARACWYAYYIPLLCLPLVTLYISTVIDKSSEQAYPPKWFYLYAALCPLLIVLVFTNDFHQLVFTFDAKGNWGDDYLYNSAYYIIFVYCLLSFLGAIILLMIKSRKSPNRFAFLLPLIAAVLLIFYNIGYMRGVSLARDTNYSVAFCFLVLLFSEAVLQAGLIPINTHYKQLFTASPLQMQLLNEAGKTALIANDSDILTEAQRKIILDKADVILKKDKNTLLHSCKISGGTIVWQEDITKLNALLDEIAASVQKLQAANVLLQQEYEIGRKKTSAEIKVNLLTMLEEDLSEKNRLLAKAVKDLPDNRDGWEHPLAHITLLLCYIKRHSNLFFLSQEGREISGIELTVYLDELSEFASYAGVHALVRCEDIKSLPIRTAALYYDCYFTMLSWAVEESSSTLIGRLYETDELISFTILSSVQTNTLHFQEPFYHSAKETNTRIERYSNEDSDGIYLTTQKEGGIHNV